jgi:hypothetical protein
LQNFDFSVAKKKKFRNFTGSSPINFTETCATGDSVAIGGLPGDGASYRAALAGHELARMTTAGDLGVTSLHGSVSHEFCRAARPELRR